MFLDRATDAALFDGRRSSDFDLLLRPGESSEMYFDAYRESCLQDLQELMDQACEAGEVRICEQLKFPFATQERRDDP